MRSSQLQTQYNHYLNDLRVIYIYAYYFTLLLQINMINNDFHYILHHIHL